MSRTNNVLFRRISAAVFLCAMLWTVQAAWGGSSPPTPHSTTEQTAIDAYIYGYPLVLEEYTRQLMLASGQLNEMNQFTSSCYLLDPTDKNVKRPNNDTLYSQAFLDLSTEPYILHVPDTTGYYYLIQIMDGWTNTFASPGTRTTGSSAQDFAIVGPDWKGQLPRPIKVIKSPTNMVWIVGRTEVNIDTPPEGTCIPPSYDNVHAILKAYTLTALSKWPNTEPSPLFCSPPAAADEPTPPDLIAELSGVEFFTLLSQLMAANPAAMQDQPALQSFKSIGFVPGAATFDPPDDMVEAINEAPAKALKLMTDTFDTLGDVVNEWRVVNSDIGTYGTNYLNRAAVAWGAPAANLPADGFYPSTLTDEKKIQLNGSTNYVIHFDPVPPVHPNAFWSVTLYDKDGFFLANSICRYAIHSTDQAIKEAIANQTPVEILLQPDPPDASKIGFWLPTPAPLPPDQDDQTPANFSLTLRMYWPEKEALKGKWVPPPVQPPQ